MAAFLHPCQSRRGRESTQVRPLLRLSELECKIHDATAVPARPVAGLGSKPIGWRRYADPVTSRHPSANRYAAVTVSVSQLPFQYFSGLDVTAELAISTTYRCKRAGGKTNFMSYRIVTERLVMHTANSGPCQTDAKTCDKKYEIYSR